MFLQVPTWLRIGTIKTILCETDNFFLAWTSKSCAKLMLRSGSTFKVKVRSHSFQNFVGSRVTCIWRVWHGNKIVQYPQNFKVTKLTKAILESSYGALQVTSKWKTLKTAHLFFKGFWILGYFLLLGYF